MRSAGVAIPATVQRAVGIKSAGFSPCGRGEQAAVATEAPAVPKRRTMASPAPLVPPVTRTRLSLNSSGIKRCVLFIMGLLHSCTGKSFSPYCDNGKYARKSMLGRLDDEALHTHLCRCRC